MHLHPEEPEARSWEPLDDVELAVRVRALLPPENHALVLVDGRSGLAARAELVVWVQSDRDEARRRGLQRDVELGRTPKEAEVFWDEWMRAEEPFLAEDRPWSRASLVVNGTPPGAMQADSVLALGPLDA